MLHASNPTESDMMKRLLPLVFLTSSACAPATPPEAPAPGDAPEAPERGISENRPIQDQHLRTIGFLEDGVWISNELPGGRVSDVWKEGDGRYGVQIRPENAPGRPRPSRFA